MLSAETLAATEQMIEHYRAIAARGGWQPLRGADGPARRRRRARRSWRLRQRLIVTGDLDPSAGDSPIYDSYVEAGVRRFQARHGLSSHRHHDSAATVTAMNVPVDVRLRQLEINMVRLRSLCRQPRQPLRGRQHPGGARRDGRGRHGARPATPPASARSTASRRS